MCANYNKTSSLYMQCLIILILISQFSVCFLCNIAQPKKCFLCAISVTLFVTCRAADTGMEVEEIAQPTLTIEDEVRRVDGFKLSAKLRGLDFVVTKQKLLKVG